ncbi:hypothetical protein [Achromobacter xylosoxidans]|uniref:hypothetical protein n=1 Tax=Alcaligenes xylosoxydans xylosoxydans TaxID=85698 RepID=UPI0022B883CD|nr:hypothetical protein [Achromobacter xylosoxidans]MCZ8438268.1 hypothetical protein [Achromobacter xylosoxidans]
MDEMVVTAIHELANALAGLGSWQQQLVPMAILLVVAAAGSFFGAYLKTRATNAAINDDLGLIKAQLRETTATAETIKSQVVKRGELHSLRVKKLEELMEAFLIACEFYRGQVESMFLSKSELNTDPPSHQRAIALAKFYFPELGKPLQSVILDWRIVEETAASERREAERTSSAHPDIVLDVMRNWTEIKGAPLIIKAFSSSDSFQSILVETMHCLLAAAEAPKEAGHGAV